MRVKFNASKKQGLALKYLYDDKTTEIGYGGAAWWWKSFLGTFRVWSMCMKYPWTRWFFGRKELVNLKRTTLNSYYKFLTTYGIPECDKGKLNGSDNTIRFRNKSEILLLDLAYQPSDPLYTGLWSLELTGGFIDESNEVDMLAITMINTRLGRQMNKEYGIVPKLLETFNPDKWHVYTRYYRPYKTNTLPNYRVFIPALATDNPNLDSKYIEQLQKADEVTRQRLLYGNFDYDDMAGKLFRRDEIEDLFKANIDEGKTMYLSCDVARLGKDCTVISLRKGLECLEIIKKNGLTTDQTAKFIKDLEAEYKVHRNNIIIDSDWVWGGVADQLRGCINFVNNGRPFATYTNQNFANLKAQCYFKFKELAEKRKIRIHADWEIAEDIKQELSNTLLKNELIDQKIQLESKEDFKKRVWKSPDVADSLMMRMYYEVCGYGDDDDDSDFFNNLWTYSWQSWWSEDLVWFLS